MIEAIIAIIITYFIVSLFGYVAHLALHQKWMGRFNSAHMTHHLKLYPPNDFTSDKYRRAGNDSTVKFFVIASLPMIITPIILYFCGILTLSSLIVVLVVEGLMGYLNNYLHDAFHITNHWLIGLPIFDRWVKLHYIHHINMSANFGIFSFIWDRFFLTIEK